MAVLLFSGCDGDGGRPRRARPDAEAVAPDPAPSRVLEVRVDGKPMAMRAAHAWRTERGLTVVVSSEDRSCPADASAGLDDGLEIDVDLQRALLPDGAFRWQVSMFGSFMSRDFAHDMPVEVEGDGAVGARTRVTVDFGFYDEDLRSGARRNVEVRGTIDALGCPPPASRSPAAPPRPPPQDAWLEVAGHRLPIVGASIDPDGEVTLSTGNAPCGSALDSGAEVIAMIDPEGGHANGRPLAGTTIMGAWFESSHSFTTDQPTVTATPRGDRGGATVEVELRGKADVNGYPFAVAGVVTATVCR